MSGRQSVYGRKGGHISTSRTDTETCNWRGTLLIMDIRSNRQKRSGLCNSGDYSLEQRLEDVVNECLKTTSLLNFSVASTMARRFMTLKFE